SHLILIEHLGLTRGELKRLRHCFVPLLWQHDAAIRDFRLELELACEGSGVGLSEWVNESELRRKPIKVKLQDAKKTVSVELVPDGLFTLELPDGQSKRCFLEIDCATQQSPARF